MQHFAENAAVNCGATDGESAIHLRQLRYFVKIVEAGSFSRAAALAYIAQSALSNQIAELEQELGVALLHRTPRGVRPTAAGETLYRDALAVIDMFDRIPDNVRATGLDVAGSVSLGMPSTLASNLGGLFIRVCQDALPHVNLSFMSEDSASLIQRVLEHRLDLAIIHEADPMPGFVRMPLFRQQLYLVHIEEALRDAESIGFAQLAERPLIVPPVANALRRLVDDEFASAGIKPTIAAEMNDIVSAVAAIRSGIGAIILPTAGLGAIPGGESLITTPMTGPIYLTANVVSAQDAPLSRAAEAVRSLMPSFLSRYVAEHPSAGMELLAN